MQDFLSYSFAGLTSAAIYGVAAAGLVLTYTTTGTFNFSHGAIGMLAAFTYWQLRFSWHWPAPLALAVCLLVLAPLLGAVLELAIFRKLQSAAEYTRLVVTIGLLVGMLGAALWIWNPNTAHPVRELFQGDHLLVAGVRMTYHQLASMLIAAVVVVGLRLLLYRTRIGISMRATVDDRSLALLNGSRPDRGSLLAWAIGASLAALSGILISPTLQMSALPLTLLIVNAYAAAMIGRLRSLPWTFVGALLLGLADAYARGYLPQNQYLDGFKDAIPVLILFVVLLVLPNPRLRGRTRARVKEVVPLPTWNGAIIFSAVVIAGSAMVLPLVSTIDLATIGRLWGVAIIGLSLVPLVGYAGQVSLCQFSFAGIGAMVVAHLGKNGEPLALLWAALIAGAIGALVALPSLRLSGIYLALSTAAFASAMDRWVFALPKFTLFGHNVNLFQSGSLEIHRPKLFGVSFAGDKAYFMLLSVAFVVAAMVVVAIRRSMFGYRLLAMKDSPAACATLGLNLTLTKLAVFTLSAAMAGVGGALYAGSLGFASAEVFSLFAGLPVLLVMVVSGIAVVGGALACGISVGAPILAKFFPGEPELPLVLFGFAGVGLGRNPNGFVIDLRERFDALRRRPDLMAVTGAVLLGVWGLRMAKVMTNWPYAIISLVILLGSSQLPALVSLVSRKDRPGRRVRAETRAPLEWMGITEPYTAEVVADLDRALGLPEPARG